MTGSAGGAAGLVLGAKAFGQSVAAPSDDGFRVLRAKAGLKNAAHADAPIWSYEGSVPGPLLRFKQGDELKIRLVNELPEMTAIHWHGVRPPSSMDGTPSLSQSPVESGDSFEYRFKLGDAGTYWYHAPASSGQVGRGLYGTLIVEEASPPALDRDTVLVFDTRLLRAEDVAVKTNERRRLRLINATTDRAMSFRIDRHSIWVMAVDGQPAQPFLARDSRVSLGPGNRIDIFLDAGLEPGESASILLDNSGTEKEISRLVYGDEKRRASPMPDPQPLSANPLPERIDMRNALRVDAPIDESVDSRTPIWTKPAGSSGQFGRPLFSLKRGRAVVMTFPNRTDVAHTIHLHGHHVRLLDNLDDGWKPFWLDSLMIGPRQTARIAFVADNPGKWLIDCQPIGQDNAVKAAWFEVT